MPEQKPQRQDSLAEQMHDLIRLAEREGMYDAADYLKKEFPKKYDNHGVEYGDWGT